MEILLIYIVIAIANAVIKYLRREGTSEVGRRKPIEYPPPPLATRRVSPTAIPEKPSYRQSREKEEVDIALSVPLSMDIKDDALELDNDAIEWSDMDEGFYLRESDLGGESTPVERKTSIKLERTALINGIILSEVLGPPRCKRKGILRVH